MITIEMCLITNVNQRPKVSSWPDVFHCLFPLFEAERIIAGFKDAAVVSDSIQKRCSHLRIAEHAAPFAERKVGGDYQ